MARAAPSPPRGRLRKRPALKGRWDRGPAGPARGGADWRRTCEPPDDLRFRLPPPPCPRDRCSASAGGAVLTHVLGGAETGDVAWGIDPHPHGSTRRSGCQLSFPCRRERRWLESEVPSSAQVRRGIRVLWRPVKGNHQPGTGYALVLVPLLNALVLARTRFVFCTCALAYF